VRPGSRARAKLRSAGRSAGGSGCADWKHAAGRSVCLERLAPRGRVCAGSGAVHGGEEAGPEPGQRGLCHPLREGRRLCGQDGGARPFGRCQAVGQQPTGDGAGHGRDIFEVTSFVQTLTQVLSDFGLSEKAPGPASLPGAPPAPEAAPATPEAAPGPRPESGPAMLVPAANQQPTFKVLFASERPRKLEDEQSECSEPENATLAPAFPKMPAFSKAKPQDPPTLSSLLDSYAEEEAPSPQEVVELSDPEEAPAEGPKALTPSGAKARAEARRAKAKA
ncbi:unnamed protein product, partial [Effrenium voratum]